MLNVHVFPSFGIEYQQACVLLFSYKFDDQLSQTFLQSCCFMHIMLGFAKKQILVFDNYQRCERKFFPFSSILIAGKLVNILIDTESISAGQ